jgi:hypothetical protein
MTSRCPHCEAVATLTAGKLDRHGDPFGVWCEAWGLTPRQAARVDDVADSQWIDNVEAADLLRTGCVN